MPAKRQTSDPIQPRRPRGRPKTEDLAALEARLILVGRQLFYRHGYGATAMSAVAEAARVSKTTLYARFPSKAPWANLFNKDGLPAVPFRTDEW